MKIDAAYDNNVLTEPKVTNNEISTDEDVIQNIDPLIEPLIDVDEFGIQEINDEKLAKIERKFSSKLTVHSYQNNETNSISQTTRRSKGILYALLGSFLFTCSGFIIKQLRVEFFDALLFRFIVQTIILTIFITYKRYKILNGSFNLILLQIVRTILASTGLILFYSSYRYIPLPDLTTVRYTQVIWTAILAVIILHERISLLTIVAILLTIVGVVCVAQPTLLFNNNNNNNNNKQILYGNQSFNTMLHEIDLESNQTYRFLGLGLALASALAISFSIVLNKKLLVLKFPQSILMFQFSLLNLSILILNQMRNRFMLHMYTNQTMFTWQFALAASASLIQLFSSTITQQAIKLEHPSIISVVQSSDILFAIILQNLFAHTKSNLLVILGSMLVTTSIFLTGFHKFWKDRKITLSHESNSTKV